MKKVVRSVALLSFALLSEIAIAQNVPQKSTPADLVNAMHTTFGDNHSRAVHAKGIILEGRFTPASGAAKITKAFQFQSTASEVVVRFSNFTGIPTIPDNIGAANPRGIAVKFKMPDGTTADIIGHSFNGFPTSDSDQFRELLLCIAKSGAEAPKPTALDNFFVTHPIAKTFLTTQKTPASYATISYFGVNSFEFTNKKNDSNFIRYQFIPEEGEVLLTPEQIKAAGAEYLFPEIEARLKKHAVRFKLYAQVAEKGDVIADPSIAWPEKRKKVLLGIIEITKVSQNDTTADKALSFNPSNIPDGIKMADPMLELRTKAYPISLEERQ